MTQNLAENSNYKHKCKSEEMNNSGIRTHLVLNGGLIGNLELLIFLGFNDNLAL
jgi:hypothetical protein